MKKQKKFIIIKNDRESIKLKNDFVLAMTGYQPNFELLKSVGIKFNKDKLAGKFDLATKSELDVLKKIVEKQQKEINDKNSLSNLDDLTDDQVTLLRNSDILSINDVADLSIDELLDIIDISNETAGKVIMQARESWFDEENDGQR